MSDKDKVIFEFPVLWEGWECDSDGKIWERTDGTRYLTIGGKYEDSFSELYERIREYEKVIADTRKAINILNA